MGRQGVQCEEAEPGTQLVPGHQAEHEIGGDPEPKPQMEEELPIRHCCAGADQNGNRRKQ